MAESQSRPAPLEPATVMQTRPDGAELHARTLQSNVAEGHADPGKAGPQAWSALPARSHLQRTAKTVCCTTSVCAPNFGFHLDTATRCKCYNHFHSLLLQSQHLYCSRMEFLQNLLGQLRICQALRYLPGHMLSDMKLPHFTGIWLA